MRATAPRLSCASDPARLFWRLLSHQPRRQHELTNLPGKGGLVPWVPRGDLGPRCPRHTAPLVAVATAPAAKAVGRAPLARLASRTRHTANENFTTPAPAKIALEYFACGATGEQEGMVP
eukprot:scaffold32111_cov26-Tisochrysis_lutea.AAC.1